MEKPTQEIPIHIHFTDNPSLEYLCQKPTRRQVKRNQGIIMQRQMRREGIEYLNMRAKYEWNENDGNDDNVQNNENNEADEEWGRRALRTMLGMNHLEKRMTGYYDTSDTSDDENNDDEEDGKPPAKKTREE